MCNMALATLAVAAQAPAHTRSHLWKDVLERCCHILEFPGFNVAMQSLWMDWKEANSNQTIHEYNHELDQVRALHVHGVSSFHCKMMCSVLFPDFLRTQASNPSGLSL